MHGKYRHADIYNVHTKAGKVFRDRSAAADIYLTELAYLPGNVTLIEYGANLGNVLCRSVGGIVLSAAAGVFGNTNAAVDKAGVVFLESVGEGGVVSAVNVCRKTAGVS